MSDAILGVALCRRQLVVSGELKLVIVQPENGIGSPDVWIGWTTSRSTAAAPLISEDDLLAVVRKCGRVPVSIIWIVYCIDALRIHRIFDVEQ